MAADVETPPPPRVVVFHDAVEYDCNLPCHVGAKFTVERRIGASANESVKTPTYHRVARLGTRFGPVIAILSAGGEFQAHYALRKEQHQRLLQVMNAEEPAHIISLDDAPSLRVVRYRRSALLRLRVTYTPDLAQDSMERSPRLDLSLSDDVARRVTYVHDLSADVPTTRDVEMHVSMVRPTVPFDALLNIQAYAKYRNKQGQWCDNQCGYANMALAAVQSWGNESEAQFCRLLVNNSANPEANSKGSVSIQFLSFRFDEGEDVPIDRQPDTKRIRDELREAETSIRRYINVDRTRCYATMPAATPSIERVTVFTFQTQSHGFVMGPYFDVFRVPRARTEYMLNILELGRARSYDADRDPATMSLKQLFGTRCPRRPQLKVVMWSLAVYVTSCLYITDEVDHNHRQRDKRWARTKVELMESFDNMIIRDAGDCEDFTRAMLVLIMSLKRCYSGPTPKGATEGIVLMHQVTALLNCFVACSGLCGVSSMALADLKRQQQRGAVVELNGHEAVFMIPLSTFADAHARHDPSSSLSQYFQALRQSEPERFAHTDDIIYPLEGTGVLNPEPSSKSRAQEALEARLQKLADHHRLGNAMEEARTMFTYDPHGGNNFYKMIITLMTPEFYALVGIPQIEFVLYNRHEGGRRLRNNRQIGHRGVWFQDLLQLEANPNICLFACPKLTPELERVCAMITKDNEPIWRPYQCLKQVPAAWLQYERDLNQGDTTTRTTTATYYIPAERMSAERVQQFKQLAALAGCTLRCRLEAIRQNPNGHQVGNYCLAFNL